MRRSVLFWQVVRKVIERNLLPTSQLENGNLNQRVNVAAVGRAYMFKDTATANALGYTASNIFLETPRKAYGLRLATPRQEQSMPSLVDRFALLRQEN